MVRTVYPASRTARFRLCSSGLSSVRTLAAASLIFASLISVGTALLTKWRDTVCAGMYFKVVNIFTDKLLEMDYIDIDNSAVYEKLSTIRQSQNGGGWGLYRVIGSAESDQCFQASV